MGRTDNTYQTLVFQFIVFRHGVRQVRAGVRHSAVVDASVRSATVVGRLATVFIIDRGRTPRKLSCHRRSGRGRRRPGRERKTSAIAAYPGVMYVRWSTCPRVNPGRIANGLDRRKKKPEKFVITLPQSIAYGVHDNDTRIVNRSDDGDP